VVFCGSLWSFAVLCGVSDLLCGHLWSFAVLLRCFWGPLRSFVLCGVSELLCGPLWSFAVFSITLSIIQLFDTGEPMLSVQL